MANHPPLSLVDVFAATLPTLRFIPDVHINYAETVLPMRDGLPKLKDFPTEFGGSGEKIAECTVRELDQRLSKDRYPVWAHFDC
jgi:hypothetical protein